MLLIVDTGQKPTVAAMSNEVGGAIGGQRQTWPAAGGNSIGEIQLGPV